MTHGAHFVLGILTLLTSIAAPANDAGTFVPTGNMLVERFGHTATLLSDGRVLIAGGQTDPMSWGRDAELYDPVLGRFVPTGPMVLPRQQHSGTLLANGKVLLAGGTTDTRAEIYDPSTGEFSLTGSMRLQHWHSAALLGSGKVLIAGDAGAELYDPATGRFEPAGAYAKTPLYFVNTATVLPDGKVLLVGDDPAQLYDPASDTFSLSGSLGAATNIYGLELHTATLLGNGKVLIAGGMNDEVSPLGLVAAAALYDPVTRAFSATSKMHAPRDGHAAAVLPDGKALVVGGYSASCDDAIRCGGGVASAELYDPSAGRFVPAASMNARRVQPRATRLGNGDVLITGGVICSELDCDRTLLSAEIYRPASSMPSYQGSWWASPAGSEPGWGVNLVHQGDILFATWFTYDLDGSDMWLVMSSGRATAAGSYSGTLYRTTGPGFSAAPFTSLGPRNYIVVGSLSFSFTDADTGTMTYTLNGVTRSKPITRFIYAAQPPSCTVGGVPGPAPNYQDLWWASPPGSESGWGVNITHQGDIVFATWFTYESGGTASVPARGMWLVMSNGARSAPGVYSGPLHRSTGPAFDAEPFDSQRVTRTAVGDATFTFSDANSGTFRYTVNGITQSKPITRYVYASPVTVCK